MKTWQIAPVIIDSELKLESSVSPVIHQLLYNRGLRTAADIRDFFSPPAYHDPFMFKNMAAAVELIIKHIKDGNRIVVYGDYDADGVTASVTLLETLQILHARAEVYLPDRVTEGYGLNKAAIDSIAARGTKLIVTVDNGIRNKEEANYAKSLGVDVIITDHHVLPEQEEDLPRCLYLDPADPHDTYPWRYLAGVGVAFKLVSALLAKSKLSPSQKKLIQERCLDLVAVGTVSDMVSLLGENRVLVKDGLQVLNQGKRLGLAELAKAAKLNGGRLLEAWNIGWQIGPRLNAASRLAHANTAFALLTTTDPAEAKELAEELNRRNTSRQEITAQMIAQVEAQIDPENLPLVIIGVAPSGQVWNEGVVGLVAGRITEKYYRPTLVISRLNDEEDSVKVGFKGSGRSVEEFNLIQAVEKASEYLHKHGGHPMACGFSILDEENLEKFKAAILAEAAAQLDPADLNPKLKIEAVLEFSDVNLETAEQVSRLAPFGQNNQQPKLASFALRIDDVVTMGADNQHIKFRLSQADSNGVYRSCWALLFGGSESCKHFQVGDIVDLAYYLEINDFNGRREPQLKIVDMKISDKDL